MFEVTIEETFAAGHALRNYRGKCENVHGHNYGAGGDRGREAGRNRPAGGFLEVKSCMGEFSTAWITSS